LYNKRQSFIINKNFIKIINNKIKILETMDNKNKENNNIYEEAAVIDIPEQIGIIEKKNKYKHVYIYKQFSIPRVYTTALMGFGMYIVINIALTVLLNLMFGPANDNTSSNQDGLEEGFKKYHTAGLIFLIFYTCIGAPILEEFVFRSILFKIINYAGKRVQEKQKFLGILIRGFAFVFSSFIFAFAHYSFKFSLLVKEIRTFHPYFVMGLIFAWAYNRDNYLLASIATHSLNNTIVTVLSLIVIYLVPQSAETVESTIVFIDFFKLSIIKLFNII